MRIRIVLLILAIIFGIAAVIGVMIYIGNVKASIQHEEELVKVAVAAQNISKEIKVSDIIEKKFFEIKEMPRKYLVEGALNSIEDYKDYITKVSIKKGEQFTADKFGKVEDIRAAFAVPQGYIAISIPYDEIRGVSNLINVGDKVNVIATFAPSEGDLTLLNKDIVAEKLLDISQSETNQNQISTEPSTSWFPSESLMEKDNYIVFPQTKVLLWNVEVLYIGSKIVSAVGDKSSQSDFSTKNQSSIQQELKTVTLALTPEQAEKLVFSEELGRVWLALVPAEGIEEKETPGRTYLNILDQ